MKLKNITCLIVSIGIIFFSSGCIPILIGAGVGLGAKAMKSSNAKHKRNELETTEEYGKYRIEMQQKNIEPILSYEEWLKTQDETCNKTDTKKINE